MNIQSLMLTILRLLLGIIFLASFVGKVNAPRQFGATLVAFGLIPNAWVQPVAFTLISAESLVAILLLMGWQSRVAAALGAFLLVIFTIALGSNLLRGNTDLECGCFGARLVQKVNLHLIGRNIVLLIAALCVNLWGGGLLALDSHPLVWKRLFMDHKLLPIILVCVGAPILILLAQQLYRLLLLIPLEE